jgi:hypothetical protein
MEGGAMSRGLSHESDELDHNGGLRTILREEFVQQHKWIVQPHTRWIPEAAAPPQSQEPSFIDRLGWFAA